MRTSRYDSPLSPASLMRLAVIGGLAWIAYAIRDVLALVLGALFLAVLMEPFADALERRRMPRSIAAIVVYGIALTTVGGLMYVVVPPAILELRNALPLLAPYMAGSGAIHAFEQNWITGFTSVIGTLEASGISGAVPQLLGLGSSTVRTFTTGAVLLILAYYFIAEKDAVLSLVSRFAPEEYHPFINQLAHKLRDRLGAWLRGELMLMGMIFLLTYIALSLIGVPYALILALLAGALEVIPFMGPLFSAVPAVLLALALSPLHAIVVIGAYVLIQGIEGQVLVPKVMQHATGMNPLLSLLAVLIGWTLGGVPGAILAIPLANAAMVFAEEINIL